MQWSYSGSRTFRRCQRRWYFQTIVPNSKPNAKDHIRREAFFLAQLQSVEAWRGSIVDWVIDKQIIRPLNQVGRFSEQHVWLYAEEIFNAQLQFAREKRYRDDGMTKTKGDDQYAALFMLEHGYLDVPEADLERAWQDIEMALTNLLADDEILFWLHEADQLLPQRNLYLHDDDFLVKAVPDVVLFYEDAPPLIVDWKVHTTGQRDYWLQLACYALALTRGEPHKDFLVDLQKYSPTDIRLLEVQLLLPEKRWYELTEDDVDVVENYI